MKLGFTLIEVLVAFSLIAVISALGFASFSSYSRRQIVYQAAEEFKEAVTIARFNAISNLRESCNTGDTLNNYTVNICVNNNPECSDPPTVPDAKGYKVRASCSSGDVTVSWKEFAEGITLETSGFPAGETVCGADIVFGSVETPSTIVPCKIFISGFGYQIEVAIDSQGYVSF